MTEKQISDAAARGVAAGLVHIVMFGVGFFLLFVWLAHWPKGFYNSLIEPMKWWKKILTVAFMLVFGTLTLGIISLLIYAPLEIWGAFG
ncbi:MAG: hypothetical protein UZ21_OP11001000254 [Microgenomates bacterium OLB22]|nr:MAG: hypothetical protein UZ21_OP11001000254 [Microgenomates bacterium OLB22]